MISFPNCKINLGLHVREKRNDGFHEIETLYYPLPVHDILELIPAVETSFYNFGISTGGTASENLCMKAYELLKQDFPIALQPVKIFLHKTIPVGAGLGGGSSDGSFTLRGLNDLFGLSLPRDELARYASRLGSDCPFFIHDTPCLARGRGEILEHTELDLSGYSFLVVCPGITVQTAWAFSMVRPSVPDMLIADVTSRPVPDWKGLLRNDFEKIIFERYPALAQVKNKLYAGGALYASLSGSGSALFGIFEKKSFPSISFGKDFRVFTIN